MLFGSNLGGLRMGPCVVITNDALLPWKTKSVEAKHFMKDRGVVDEQLCRFNCCLPAQCSRG